MHALLSLLLALVRRLSVRDRTPDPVERMSPRERADLPPFHPCEEC